MKTIAMLSQIALFFSFLATSVAGTTTLTNRTNTGVSYVEGPYVEFQPGYLSGTWLLFHNTDWVTLTGTGYLRVRWEVEYWKSAGESVNFLANSTGTWLLAAGGGGFQFGDSPAPFCNDPSGACLNATGGTDYGYTWFSDGTNPWHDEYYWLDGTVTLQTEEGAGSYNIAVEAFTYDDLLSDINSYTDSAYHYGASYDPSEGACPCSA